MSITEEQRKKWRALAAAASPGPWFFDDCNVFSRPISDAREAAILARLDDPSLPSTNGMDTGLVVSAEQAGRMADDDTEFIAEARTAVPALLDEVERLMRVEAPAKPPLPQDVSDLFELILEVLAEGGDLREIRDAVYLQRRSL